MKISVIIATHARPASLARLLSSLASQLVRGQHELFIAENGTRSPTDIATVDIPLTHLHDPRAGKCHIQNRAIALAQGDVVALLDDDLVAAPCYLAAVGHFFDDYPHFGAMKGRILPARDPLTIVGRMAPYLDLPIVDHGEKVVEVRGVIGANMAFRASALQKLKLTPTHVVVGDNYSTTVEALVPMIFDERLGPGAAGHEEETELSRRLRNAGFHIGYAPEALVLHEVDPTRADRARFTRVARERGYCRTLHEDHSPKEVALKIAISTFRLGLARAFHASVARVAREERRLAVAQGMRAGLALAKQSNDPQHFRPR